jgi:hypothetical protein
MLFIAIMCFTIGQFIDIKNLKSFVIVFIFIIMILKLFDFTTIKFENDDTGDNISIRLSVSFAIFRVALYFIF